MMVGHVAPLPASAGATPIQRGVGRGTLVWLAALGVVAGLVLAGDDVLPWAHEYPKSLEVPVKRWIAAFTKWLINEADLGLFTVQELTRGIAWLLDCR